MNIPLARRVAFVSDIHGNLPAFEAVLTKLDELGPFDAVVSGGDLATGGAFPSECVARTRSLPWAHLRGNGDEILVWIATDGRVPLRDFPEDADPEMWRGPGSLWAAGRLAVEDVEFLAGLPLDWKCLGPSGQSLKFVHATPWSTHPIVWEDASEAEKRELVERGGTDALVYGHIHYPYVQEIGGKLLACAGSVGAPFDGDPRACFAIAADEGDGWSIEHVRVDYDLDAYARAILESGMPNPEQAIEELRAARLPAEVRAALRGNDARTNTEV
ncbi:MAG TPA: metallophosphoesterase family protein [Thermomicrobiales bacterium]|nr:metallophosphoesterase family protein [Thermomicrobiales bacterium]